MRRIHLRFAAAVAGVCAVAGFGGACVDTSGGCPAAPPELVAQGLTDFCGDCGTDTCFYCPPGECSDPCFLAAGGDCGVGKAIKPGKVTKSTGADLLGIIPDGLGGYEVRLDSGLKGPAEVTWFSSLEGQLATTGEKGTLCLSMLGTHVLTYSAKIPGQAEDERVSGLIEIEVQ